MQAVRTFVYGMGEYVWRTSWKQRWDLLLSSIASWCTCFNSGLVETHSLTDMYQCQVNLSSGRKIDTHVEQQLRQSKPVCVFVCVQKKNVTHRLLITHLFESESLAWTTRQSQHNSVFLACSLKKKRNWKSDFNDLTVIITCHAWLR